MKRHKILDNTFIAKPAKIIGYKPSDFRKLTNYRFNAFKVPFSGSNFEDAKKAVIPTYHNISNSDNINRFNQIQNRGGNFNRNRAII